MRSDKNSISEGARTDLPLLLERAIVRHLFDLLCPVSQMTMDYYAWPANRPVQLFPYCTDERKFTSPHNGLVIRRLVRARFSIPQDAFVFLAVVKFVNRENPRGVINAFERVVASRPTAWLLMVGAGPSFEHEQRYAAEKGISNITFVGYVPYTELESYFFSADAFVHLPISEPWGISAQDALLAGLGLVASNRVGSAVTHLVDELSRFVVPADNIDVVAERMAELVGHGDVRRLFQPACLRVRDGFTTKAVCRGWAGSVVVSTALHRS